MAAKHLAWLLSKPSKNAETRLETLLKRPGQSQLIETPTIDYAEYLLEYANEIGLYASNGFGLEPISWSRIADWQLLTKTNLNRFEATTIVLMSKSFVSYHNEINETVVPPPYQPDSFDRATVGKQAGSLFRSLALRNKSRFKGPKM